MPTENLRFRAGRSRQLVALGAALLSFASIPMTARASEELGIVRPRQSFNPKFETNGAQIVATLATPEGIYVAGSITRVGSLPRERLARLTPAGQVDTTFTPPVIRGGTIRTFARQADGKLVIAGSFTQVAGLPRARLARVNVDGTLDTTFAVQSGFNGNVLALLIAPDGTILAGGGFSTFNNTPRNGLARINADGTLDLSFTPPGALTREVAALAFGLNGRILAGGRSPIDATGFSREPGLIRLLSDGTLDTTFSVAASTTVEPSAIVLQPGGRVVVTGSILFPPASGIGNQEIRSMARLNNDGSRDVTFAEIATSTNTIRAIAVQTDGAFLLTGYANSATYLSRTNPSGIVDVSFTPSDSFNGTVSGLALQSDGSILAFGNFTLAGAPSHAVLTRFNATGTVDHTFAPSFRDRGFVGSVLPAPGGGWLIGGRFDYVNDSPAGNIARLNDDGSVDTTFGAGAGFNAYTQLLLRADGRILAFGGFSSFNGELANRLVRLSGNGTRDPTFATGSGFNGEVTSVQVLDNDQLIVAGGFTSYNGTTRKTVARLEANGDLDLSFDPGAGAEWGPGVVARPTIVLPEPGGRFIVGGSFFNFAGTNRQSLVRLEADGSLDATYSANTFGFFGATLFGGVDTARFLTGGRLIVVGSFSDPNSNLPKADVARIATNGTLDPSFQYDVAPQINTLLPQPNGKLLLGGRSVLTRITDDGTTDATFSVTGMMPPSQPFSGAPAPGSIIRLADGPNGTLFAGNYWVDFADFTSRGLLLLEPIPSPATVTLGNLNRTYSGGPESVVPTTNPTGLSVTVTYNDSATPPINAGSYDVVATINDSSYSGFAAGTLTIAKAAQTIYFTAPPPMAATAAPFPVDATATSGLPVIFSVVSGPATITGNTVTLTGAGTVTIRATQPGGLNYFATEVDRSFIVSKVPASISLAAVAFVYDGSPKSAIATTTPSGLAVDFTYNGSSIPPIDAGAYDIIATINEPSYTGSAAGTLTISPATAALTITGTAQPFDGTPKPVAVTTAPANLTTSITYNGSTTAPSQVGTYAVAASIVHANYVGNTTATLEIAPGINPGQPSPRVVSDGAETTLTVSSAGIDPAATFRWQIEVPVAGPSSFGPRAMQWIDIPGATTASYRIASTQRFNDGRYRVVITTNGVSVLSLPFTVTVAPSPPNDARLLNLSTRAQALTGDDVLIPGFVIAGTGNKRLLIRAVGPTLGKVPFNLAGTLADPRLRLLKRNSTTQAFEEIAANDNWGTNTNPAAITQTAADVFAFAFNDDREAALLLDIEPGEYTVIARGVNDATGLAIVELYDADSGNPAAKLINISNRGFAGVGDQVMIPGFVVSSEGPKTFLIRVVGPTLGGFGVAGTMADPKLEVFPGGASTPILANDNWGDNPDAAYTAQVVTQVSAFPLTAGSKDAAFVITLPPGSYTVVGSSAVAGGTGVVLVEVYVVP